MCQLFHTNAQDHQIWNLELVYKKVITYFQTKEKYERKYENWKLAEKSNKEDKETKRTRTEVILSKQNLELEKHKEQTCSPRKPNQTLENIQWVKVKNSNSTLYSYSTTEHDVAIRDNLLRPTSPIFMLLTEVNNPLNLNAPNRKPPRKFLSLARKAPRQNLSTDKKVVL